MPLTAQRGREMSPKAAADSPALRSREGGSVRALEASQNPERRTVPVKYAKCRGVLCRSAATVTDQPTVATFGMEHELTASAAQCVQTAVTSCLGTRFCVSGLGGFLLSLCVKKSIPSVSLARNILKCTCSVAFCRDRVCHNFRDEG